MGIIHKATIKGNIELVKYLIKLGFDVNLKSKSNQTALMMACNFKKPEIVKLLIENNADVHNIDSFGFKYFLFNEVHFYMQLMKTI